MPGFQPSECSSQKPYVPSLFKRPGDAIQPPNQSFKARPPAIELLAAWLKPGLQGLLCQPQPTESDPREVGPWNLHFNQLPADDDATTVWGELFLGLSILTSLSSHSDFWGNQIRGVGSVRKETWIPLKNLHSDPKRRGAHPMIRYGSLHSEKCPLSLTFLESSLEPCLIHMRKIPQISSLQYSSH